MAASGNTNSFDESGNWLIWISNRFMRETADLLNISSVKNNLIRSYNNQSIRAGLSVITSIDICLSKQASFVLDLQKAAYAVIFSIQGSFKLKISDRKLLIAGRQFVIIEKGTDRIVFDFEKPAGYKLLFIVVHAHDQSLFNGFLPNTGSMGKENVLFGRSFNADIIILKWIQTLLDLVVLQKTPQRLVRNYLIESLKAICTEAKIQYQQSKVDISLNADQILILQLAEQLIIGMDDKMQLDTIAKNLSISRTKLVSIFKKHVGVPVLRFKLTARLEKAIQLLSQTDKPIREIGNETGFTNPAYFSTMFKSKTGFTPRSFRNSSMNPGKTA
jgi:AraC-like DNA-binding protein